MPDKSKNAPNYPKTEDGLWEAFFDTDEMMEYVDASDKIGEAMERGDAEVALPTAFLAKVLSGTINYQDPQVVAAWNRCCDLVGLPDHKKTEPGPTADEMRAAHGVKKMRIGPLKRGKTGDTGDSGGGGPF